MVVIGHVGSAVESNVGSGEQAGGFPAAKRLDPERRFALAMRVLRGEGSITGVAEELDVSRKFVRQQTQLAVEGAREVFAPPPLPDGIIGWLPVTKAWLHRATVSAALHCRGSERGIAQHLKAITSFEVPISAPTVHNILRKAATAAKELNERQSLSPVREGAQDEIFSQGVPVLVGVEPRSTFAYLMEAAEGRGEVEWWVALTEKHERQGLNLVTSISDAARGLISGTRQAFPGIDLRGDVLHAQMEISELLSYLENRAYAKLRQQEQEEVRMTRAKRHRKGNERAKKLALARTQARDAVALYDEMALLLRWLTELLQLVGPDPATRLELYDWLLAEMETRAPSSHRIGPLVNYLRHQRDPLLAFALALAGQLDRLAAAMELPRALVEAAYQQSALDPASPRFQEIEYLLLQQAPNRAAALKEAVQRVLKEILRASSAVENINSILRTFATLRRSLGPEFLHLLQFYLNHRCLQRSHHPNRVAKSPSQLLTGQPHDYWLTMLGYLPPVLRN